MKTDHFNQSYIGERPDIQRLIPTSVTSVLDVGCSTGELGSAIKNRTGARVSGIEMSAEMATEAKKKLDQVYIGDAELTIDDRDAMQGDFDAIIFADVLEHTVDPWTLLEKSVERLQQGGVVIASIPNIRHISTIYSLMVSGYWPYRDRGIHDVTHLRFFTLRNIRELFEKAGLTIEKIDTNYRLIEKPHRINKIAKFAALPGIKNFLAFQYLIRAKVA